MAIPVKYLRQDENASPLISSVRLFNKSWMTIKTNGTNTKGHYYFQVLSAYLYLSLAHLKTTCGYIFYSHHLFILPMITHMR